MGEAQRRVLIAGAGLAGDRAAFALRDRGFEGRIALLGAEPERPYDRPPLSKAILKSPADDEALYFRPTEAYADAGIELVLGAPVVEIEANARRARLATSETLGYDALILATGSQLREHPSFPKGAPGVFYLRNRADAVGLRAAFDHGGRVVVIGGGVIGLEVAAAAAARGLKTTVVEPAPRLMSRAAGKIISAFLAQLHREAGVDLRLGVGVDRVDGEGPERRLWLSDGACLAADTVVVGIGVLPDVELAASVGLDVSPRGVVADAHGRTSDANIFAAGEVAYHFNARLGGYDRQENWQHAAAHGNHVGRCVVEAEDPYADLSGYWTDQYHLTIQSTGRPHGDLDVIRGDIASGKFIVFHLEESRLVGATGCNAARELRAAKALLRSGALVDPAHLADPTQPVGAVPPL